MELEPAQIDRERADLAWKLRVGGLSWAQVARQAGYSCRQNAMRAVKVRCGTLPQPERQELRDLWRDRLERLWLQSVKDTAEQRTGAVTAAVRVMQAAAMLDGLNQPTQIDARFDVEVSDTFHALMQAITLNDL
jgi:hypothetical protein